MLDITDTIKIDMDTVEPETLDELFSKKYTLLTEKAVSLKKTYINKLHGTKSLKLVLGLSDNSIELYELNNTSLSKVCHLSGHKGLTEVVFSPKEDHLVYSAGCDGVVKLWDTRQGGGGVQEYKDKEDLIKPYECMDVSPNGRVLCAGTQLVEDDAYLVFWDQRMTIPLGGYWNSHTDDIIQVKFHKKKSEILATGSIDGLINIYNILEQTEDDALTYSLNVENAVAKISWLDEKQIACVTQSEDLQIWDTESADLLNSFTRDKISRKMKRSKGDDCYVVDAYTSADDSTVVLAGSHGGHENVLRTLSIANKKLQPSTDFKGNKQMVRCCWYNTDADILVTAGEAGILSAWRGGVHENGAGSKNLAHSLNKLQMNRHKPY